MIKIEWNGVAVELTPATYAKLVREQAEASREGDTSDINYSDMYKDRHGVRPIRD